MRSSLGSARKEEIKYPSCCQENHKNELMNIVCVDPSCKQKGLICNICRTTSHAKHQTKPLKMFLKVFEDFEKTPRNNSTENILSRINEMEAIERLATSVRDFEIELIKDYKNISQELESEAMGYKSVLESVEIIRSNSKPGDLQSNVSKLLSSIRYDPVKKSLDVINIGQQYLIEYTQKEYNYIEIIKQLQFNAVTALDNAKNQTKSQNPKRPFYKFNEALKPGIIKLGENNLAARQTQSNNGDLRFALIQPCLPMDKPSQITFHIKNKTNWVGLGICFKNLIVTKKFKFNYSTIGHGSYLLSTNGYTWSHSRAGDNIKLKAFAFDTGTNVKVTFDPCNNKIVYTNLDDDKFYEQNLDLTEPDKAGGVSFCANLGSHGDQIKIINVKNY